METRAAGATHLVVSRIGLGLAALGRPGYINLGHARDMEAAYQIETMEQRAHAVLDAAWQSGVRYFDAARSYGRAEQFLGSWLRSRQPPPEALTVGSKWGYTYVAGWQVNAERHEIKEHSLARLLAQWPESRLLLGSYLRLYQIHSATFASGVLEDRFVMNELARMKEDGLAIGLTLSGPDQGSLLTRALDIVIDGVRLFDTVQATWNLLEPSAGPVLAEARNAGMGIIIKEALANGRLTPRNSSPTFAAKLALLAEQAARLGSTVDAVAIAAALAQPWVDVVLSGAATIDHLQSNLAAVELRWDEEAQERLSPLAESPGVYWETRSNLPWN